MKRERERERESGRNSMENGKKAKRRGKLQLASEHATNGGTAGRGKRKIRRSESEIRPRKKRTLKRRKDLIRMRRWKREKYDNGMDRKG